MPRDAMCQEPRRLTSHRVGIGNELLWRCGSTYDNAGVADRPPRLIEGALNRFVARLVRRALHAKRQRVIDAERERRWRDHDDKTRRRLQERDSEKLRRRRLRTFAAKQARHERICQFVNGVEQRIRDERVELGALEVVRRWTDWARERLAASDPVEAFLKEPWPSAPSPGPSPRPWNWE
jgi:hypothetical protein